ncbi:MAG: hypothetical protein AB7T10_07415 [bacterium]
MKQIFKFTLILMLIMSSLLVFGNDENENIDEVNLIEMSKGEIAAYKMFYDKYQFPLKSCILTTTVKEMNAKELFPDSSLSFKEGFNKKYKSLSWESTKMKWQVIVLTPLSVAMFAFLLIYLIY